MTVDEALQQAGEALCQHRLARARWADHQQAVATGRRDLQHPLGAGMALDVGQVGIGREIAGGGGRPQAGPAVVLDGRRCRCCLVCRRDRGPGRSRALGRWRQEAGHHVEQVARGVDLGAGHQRGLPRTVGGQHQPGRDPVREQRQRHRQGTAHRSQFAGE
jgi:hypothetical protein